MFSEFPIFLLQAQGQFWMTIVGPTRWVSCLHKLELALFEPLDGCSISTVDTSVYLNV